MSYQSALSTRPEKNAFISPFVISTELYHNIISRITPVFDKERSRNTHYTIEDCFLRFWFRFIFKYRNWIELGRISSLKALIRRDFNAFAGFSLERYFRQKLSEESSYTRIGG